MKTRLFLLTALLAVLPLCQSCQLFDALYISLNGTCWFYEDGTQRAIVSFGPQDQMSVVQRDNSNGALQCMHGTFTTKGHSVYLNATDGTGKKLTRTFTHLKNSKNKNFTRLQRQSQKSVGNGVWSTVENRDLAVCYFKDASSALFSEYTAGAWSSKTLPYTLAGSELTLGASRVALFPEVLLLEHRLYLRFPSPDGSGESEVAGTMWLCPVGGAAPYLLIFDTGYSFTRIAVAGTSLVQVFRGTYTQSGQTLTMNLDGTTKVCTIANDRFTLDGLSFELSK